MCGISLYRFFLLSPFLFLQRLLATSLNREQAHGHERSKDETSTGIDGCMRVGFARVNSNNGREETADTVEATGDTSTGTTVGSREHLRGVCVQDTIHDVLEEGLETSADELDVRVGGEGEAVNDDTGDHGGDRHGTLTADVWDIDRVASENGAWNTNNRGDCVVTVN